MSWTHRTEAREREARAFAAVLGVPEANLTFHGADDGRVADQMPHLLPRFRDMMARWQPEQVICAAFEQGHTDHDATHCLVSRSFDGPIYEFPMYHPYTRRIQTMGRFADPVGEEILTLTREESQFKNRMSKMYRSQNIRSVVLWYTIYRALCLNPARLQHTERLRRVETVDYLTPSLPEPMRSEVAASSMWKRWVEAVRSLDGV